MGASRGGGNKGRKVESHVAECQLRTRKGGEALEQLHGGNWGKGKLHTSYGEIKPRASMEWGQRQTEREAKGN